MTRERLYDERKERYDESLVTHCKRWETKKNRTSGCDESLPMSSVEYKPDSVLPHNVNLDGTQIHNVVASIINLHSALPQSVKPPTRSLWPWDWAKNLFGVAAHRDCLVSHRTKSARLCCSNRRVTPRGR